MKTKTTKTIGAILFAIAAFSPLAIAGKPGTFDFPRKVETTSSRSATVHCYSTACAGMSCCISKIKTETAPNGKGMITRRVRACASDCPVPMSQHKEVCRVGSRI